MTKTHDQIQKLSKEQMRTLWGGAWRTEMLNNKYPENMQHSDTRESQSLATTTLLKSA